MPPKKKKKCNIPDKPLGLMRQHLMENFHTVPNHLNGLLKGHVLFIFINNGKSYMKTIEIIKEKSLGKMLVPRHILAQIVNSTIMKFKNLSRPTDKQYFDAICHEELVLPFQAPEPQEERPETIKLSLTTEESLHIRSNAITPEPSTSSASPPSSVRHSSRHPLTPRELKLRQRLDQVSHTRFAIKLQYLKNMRAKLRSSVSVSHHNQAIRRKNEIINRLRCRQHTHQCGEAMGKLREEVTKLRRNQRRIKDARMKELASNDQKLQEQVKSCLAEINKRDLAICSLVNCKLELEETVDTLTMKSSSATHTAQIPINKRRSV